MKRNRSPVYNAWLAMRNRCNNPRGQDYSYYGARGIRVCKRWNSFDVFAADMGPRPDGYTLERKRVNQNYTPRNCVWATREQQARNRNYVKLSLQKARQIRALYKGRGGRWGGTIRQVDLAAQFGVSQLLISRVVCGLVWREQETIS